MSYPIRPGLILLVDDDSDDRLLVKDAVAACPRPTELLCLENGEQLLDYLYRRGNYAVDGLAPRPGLILLDLNMPRKDGREALREIKSDPALRRIPVVVFTTSKADMDVANLYDLGANSFVTKPVQFEQLVTTITQLARYWFDTVELPVLRS
jgi:two-component system, response regulator